MTEAENEADKAGSSNESYARGLLKSMFSFVAAGSAAAAACATMAGNPGLCVDLALFGVFNAYMALRLGIPFQPRVAAAGAALAAILALTTGILEPGMPGEQPSSSLTQPAIEPV